MPLNFSLPLEKNEHHTAWNELNLAFNQCHHEKWMLLKNHIHVSLKAIPLEQCISSFSVYGNASLQNIAATLSETRTTLEYQESRDASIHQLRTQWEHKRETLNVQLNDIEHELDIVCNELEGLRKTQLLLHDDNASPFIQDWIKKYGDVERSPLYTNYASYPSLWPIDSAKHAIEMLVLKWKYNIRFDDLKEICKRSHRSVQLRQRFEELQEQMRTLKTEMYTLNIQEQNDVKRMLHRLDQKVDVEQATSTFYDRAVDILMAMRLDFPIRIGALEISPLSEADSLQLHALIQRCSELDHALSELLPLWYEKKQR